MTPPAFPGISIDAVNALPYAREIKELFVAHDRPEFPDYFDRAYPTAIAKGATSWVGRDSAGRLVMHIACVPRHFKFRGREVVGGLLSNLMVARDHRSFFPALSLLIRLIRDSSSRGGVDFLYADPNDESQALLRGTRFGRVATLRRYVLPVADRRLHVAVGIRVLHGLLRAANGAHGGAVVPRPAREFRPEHFFVPHDRSRRLSAYHDHPLYAAHLPGYPGERDWWLTCHRDGPGSLPDAVLLIRGPDRTGLTTLHAVRRRPGVRLLSFVPGVTRVLRRLGCARLEIMTIAESDLAKDLRRGGFVPRQETVAMFALGLTPLGEECLRSSRDWEVTDLEYDR